MVLTDVSVIAALGAGMLSFLSPCVLPLVPSYLALISGVSYQELSQHRDTAALRTKVVLNALLFIVGFSGAFIALGASFSALGRLLIGSLPFFQQLGGLLIIGFGLYVTGVFRLPALARYLQFGAAWKPQGYLGALVVGFFFAVGWTPCVGPVLGAILTLAGSTGEVNQGVVLLTAYSLGLGIPFFLSALAFDAFMQLFARLKGYLHLLHVGAGLLLIVVGVLLLTGYLTVLNSYAIRLTPQWLWERL